MILIIDFAGSDELADILRAAGIPVLIRKENEISEKELTAAVAVVSQTAAKLKNLREDLTVYTFGRNDPPPFSDGHTGSPTELVSAIKAVCDDSYRLFFFHGAAIDLTQGTAEYKGNTLRFSKSEIQIIKCIHGSVPALSARLIAEGCFGSGNSKSVMTHVWKINKKLMALASRKLITRELHGGYRIK